MSPMRKSSALCILALLLTGSTPQGQATQWQPAAGPLRTRWANDVTPDNVLPEYPRPQMVREEWRNLNGLWDYAIRPREEPAARRRSTARSSCRSRSSPRCPA